LSENLNNGKQLSLDNLTGLRGYPIRHLTGTTSTLLNIEERMYFKKALWSVINFGAAAFIDIGNIKGDPLLDSLEKKYFRSVGLGLRLSSNRTAETSVLHIDLAKPLDAHTGSRSFQLAIELKEKF